MTQRHKKQQTETEMIEYLVGEFDLELEKFGSTSYQLRISKGEKRLDYFPQKGKATWVSSNKWFVIENIERFIEENFKG